MCYSFQFNLDFVDKTEEMAKLDERIGFLGGGNMAFAIGYGLINRGILLFSILVYHKLFVSID